MRKVRRWNLQGRYSIWQRGKPDLLTSDSPSDYTGFMFPLYLLIACMLLRERAWMLCVYISHCAFHTVCLLKAHWFEPIHRVVLGVSFAVETRGESFGHFLSPLLLTISLRDVGESQRLVLCRVPQILCARAMHWPRNHLGTLFLFRLWFSWSGVGPESLCFIYFIF